MSGNDGTIEWGTLLSSRRRVLIAAYLVEEAVETPIHVSDFVTDIAKMESNDSKNQVDSDFRHSVYTTSVQYHLPALDAADVIEFDDMRVDYGDRLRLFYAMSVLLPGSGLQGRPLSP